MARSLRSGVGGFGRSALAVALLVAALATLLPTAGVAGAQEDVETNATIRVVHASPGAPEVDLLVDGQPLAESIAFGNVTDYVPLTPEQHQIQVVPTGQTAEAAVVDEELDVDSGTAHIVAVRGLLNDIEGEIYEVNLDAIEEGKARARLINLSPDAEQVDVGVTGGDTMFNGVDFGDAGDYDEVDPGTYSFDVRGGEEDRVLATVPDVTFQVGRVYDVVALGQVSDQSLNLIALETNVSRPCAEVLGIEGGAEDACVRVVHAAAGAPDVDVYVSDSPLISGLTFGAGTEYVVLPAGEDRQVQIAAAGTPAEEAILETDIDLEAGQAYQVVATAEGEEVEATVNEVNLTPMPENQARIRVVHASPDAGNVDVGIAEGPTIAEGVGFREASPYAVVDAGAYSLEVRPAGEETVALQTDIELAAGTVYDVVALGRTEDRTLALLPLASQGGVREGGLATPGAETMTTPGAVSTVAPVGTPDPESETDALEQGEDAAETVVAGAEPTATPLP